MQVLGGVLVHHGDVVGVDTNIFGLVVGLDVLEDIVGWEVLRVDADYQQQGEDEGSLEKHLRWR